MAKKPTPRPKAKDKHSKTIQTTLIPQQVVESVRFAMTRLFTLFPATPKITAPLPDSYVWGSTSSTTAPTLYVFVKTNKLTVNHRVTVTDNGGAGPEVWNHIVNPGGSQNFFDAVPGNLIESGHDYRIRVELESPAAGDEYDTVYITAY